MNEKKRKVQPRPTGEGEENISIIKTQTHICIHLQIFYQLMPTCWAFGVAFESP